MSTYSGLQSYAAVSDWLPLPVPAGAAVFLFCSNQEGFTGSC